MSSLPTPCGLLQFHNERRFGDLEVEIAKGKTTPQVCKEAGITDQSYYRWRKVTSTSGNATAAFAAPASGFTGPHARSERPAREK